MYTLANKELIQNKEKEKVISYQTNQKILQDFQKEVYFCS